MPGTNLTQIKKALCKYDKKKEKYKFWLMQNNILHSESKKKYEFLEFI